LEALFVWKMAVKTVQVCVIDDAGSERQPGLYRNHSLGSSYISGNETHPCHLLVSNAVRVKVRFSGHRLPLVTACPERKWINLSVINNTTLVL